MPTDLPERKPPEPPRDETRVSGKLVVILIVIWTAVMAMWAAYATRSGIADAVFDSRHPGHVEPGGPE